MAITTTLFLNMLEVKQEFRNFERHFFFHNNKKETKYYFDSHCEPNVYIYFRNVDIERQSNRYATGFITFTLV